MDENLTLYQINSSKAPEAKGWVNATLLGFHSTDQSEVILRRMMSNLDSEGFIATGIETDQKPVDPLIADMPVATFARYPGYANLGRKEVKAGMLTEATVRPTHKRRGLLRQMMELNLAQLAEDEVPLALLTASDARIYNRFMFQRVIDRLHLSIDPRGLELLPEARKQIKGYTTEWISRESIESITGQIYSRVHQTTRGSITRPSSYTASTLYSDSSDSVERKYRAIVCKSPEEELVGYIVYSMGPGSDGFILTIEDMAYVNGFAELSLWDHLFCMEMIKEIKCATFTADSPLFVAVNNYRALRIKENHDFLWARILDPMICLESRSYSLAPRKANMTATFKVSDPYSYAAGIFKVELSDSGAKVQRLTEDHQTEGQIEATVDAKALAALVYASATPTELNQVGLIQGLSKDNREKWDAMFIKPSAARMTTFF